MEHVVFSAMYRPCSFVFYFLLLFFNIMHRYFDSILCIVTCIFNMVLLRHGETEWNRQGRLQGSGDSPLTARGVKQARASASGALACGRACSGRQSRRSMPSR